MQPGRANCGAHAPASTYRNVGVCGRSNGRATPHGRPYNSTRRSRDSPDGGPDRFRLDARAAEQDSRLRKPGRPTGPCMYARRDRPAGQHRHRRWHHLHEWLHRDSSAPVSVTDRIKREQMAAYGLQGQRLADYELDHLISLELGGAPADVANLWPEPWTGDANAHQKDAVETHF